MAAKFREKLWPRPSPNEPIKVASTQKKWLHKHGAFSEVLSEESEKCFKFPLLKKPKLDGLRKPCLLRILIGFLIEKRSRSLSKATFICLFSSRSSSSQTWKKWRERRKETNWSKSSLPRFYRKPKAQFSQGRGLPGLSPWKIPHVSSFSRDRWSIL